MKHELTWPLSSFLVLWLIIWLFLSFSVDFIVVDDFNKILRYNASLFSIQTLKLMCKISNRSKKNFIIRSKLTQFTAALSNWSNH